MLPRHGFWHYGLDSTNSRTPLTYRHNSTHFTLMDLYSMFKQAIYQLHHPLFQCRHDKLRHLVNYKYCVYIWDYPGVSRNSQILGGRSSSHHFAVRRLLLAGTHPYFLFCSCRWLDKTPASRIIARCTQDVQTSMVPYLSFDFELRKIHHS